MLSDNIPDRDCDVILNSKITRDPITIDPVSGDTATLLVHGQKYILHM